MASIQVEAARIPDRDKLLALLREHGLEAEPERRGRHRRPNRRTAAPRSFDQVEDVIMRIGAPFVPIKHDDVIYIRPPVG